MANIPGSDNLFPKLLMVEGAAYTTPAAGTLAVYCKSSDGLLYAKDDAGVERALEGADAAAAAHIADSSDAHDASAISIVDTGAYFTGTDVEAALQELGAGGGGGSVATDTIWDAAGDLVVGTGANTAAKLAAGTNGHVLTLVTGSPAWAAPSGGGGLTQAYVGYNTVGGTTVAPSAAGRWHLKKVTLANDCLLSDIECYLAATADQEYEFAFGLWDDDAGDPVHVLARTYSSRVVPEESGSGPRDPRWYSGAFGRWLAAGDYWIGFMSNNTNINLYYDGSGTDREFTGGTSGGLYQIGDYGLWTPSTTTRKYSIRANTIR